MNEQSRERRIAKPWVRVAAPLLGVALGLALVQLFQNDAPSVCVSSTRTYDGSVVPGGPQSAEEALSGFLTSGAAADSPVEGMTPEELAEVETGDGYVIFQGGPDDEITVEATQQQEGWMIGQVSKSC